MILPRQLLTNGTLHQTRQGWQDIDWWINLPVVQLTVDEDLALGDVTSQVRDGVRDIYIDVVRSIIGKMHEALPSLGIVRMGIWVMEPLRPWTRPARS
jgi:hypothetical protein